MKDSEFNRDNLNTVPVSEDESITHLRTDDGSLRYPITVAKALFMDETEQVRLVDYLDGMGAGTLYAKQVYAVQFAQDEDGFFTYSFKNPFDTDKILCNMRNTMGENLVCSCTIYEGSISVSLIEPEDCWVLLSGDNVGNVILDGGSNDAFSHSHINKTTLDRLGNIDGRLTYSGNALAYESLIGDLSKIRGNNIVDILLRMCEMLNIDLGDPDTPEMPKNDPVISSTTNTNISKLDDEQVTIRYTLNSDTTTNTLYIITDGIESSKVITHTSGTVTVGPFPGGNHTVVLKVQDTNNRFSNELTFNIKVTAQTEVPEVPAPTITSSSSSILSGTDDTPITIEYSYSSSTTTNALYYSIDEGHSSVIQLTESDGYGSLQIGPLEAGSHTFQMYIMDSNLVRSSSITIALNIATTTEPQPEGYESIIINQVYTSGGKDDGPVSHNFIELYNTSSYDVDITDLSIHVATSGQAWSTRKLSSSRLDENERCILPGNTSFFILFKNTANTTNPVLNLADITIKGQNYNLTNNLPNSGYDNYWTTACPTISNKYYKVALTEGSTPPSNYNPFSSAKLLDCFIACNEDSVSNIEEGLKPYCLVGLSKQKSIRRKEGFIRTGLGKTADDCEIIDYRMAATSVFTPRSRACGSWTEIETPDYGDDRVQTNGKTAVIKIVLDEENLAKLKADEKATGEFWFYNAKLGNRTIKKYLEIKYQNYSGKADAKENFNIDLYVDEALTTEYEHKFETEGFSGLTWPNVSEFCLKGNRKDPSHAHNIVTSNIIRSSYQTNAIPNLANGDAAYGYIDGFPVILYINNEKQGIYTMNLTQHRKVYGINKGEYGCALFRGTSNDGVVAETVKFRELCNYTDDLHYEWEDRFPKAYKKEELSMYMESHKSGLNSLISWVKNSTDENFANNMDNHFNKDYLIDYYLWLFFGGFTDSAANNLNLVTYDDLVYIPTFYDLDATFGLHHKGSEMIPTDSSLFENYRTSDSLLWERIFANSELAPIISRRYTKLRQSTMNKEYIISQFDKFWALLPEEEQVFDEQKWSNSLMGDSNRLQTHRQQLLDWLTAREVWCDEQFGVTITK